MSDQDQPAGPEEHGGQAGAAGDGAARGEPARRLPTLARIAAAVLGPVLLTIAYFTIPFDPIAPKHEVLAWLIPAVLLAVLAVGMVVNTNRALAGTSGGTRHPALGFLLLSWAAILVFAATYWSMAMRPGQFVGLQTRLDALYFTGITMSTVGYGDIHPSGQLARGVVLVQLVYTFAFLVGGVAALRTRARATRATRARRSVR